MYSSAGRGESNPGHGRPARDDIAAAAAAAAEKRAEKYVAKKKEIKVKAARVKEAMKKAEEDEIEAMKNTAAAAGEALERTDRVKSEQAMEAARRAAEVRAAAAAAIARDYRTLPRNQGVSTLSAATDHVEEGKATSSKPWQGEISAQNTDCYSSSETATHQYSVEYEAGRTVEPNEYGKKAEEIEAGREVIDVTHEVTVGTAVNQTKVRAEERVIITPKRPQNNRTSTGLSSNTECGASPCKIPMMETITVSGGQNYTKMKSKQDVDRLHNNAKQEKEIINITNEKPMPGSNKQKANYEHETTIKDSLKVEKPNYTYSMDGENGQTKNKNHDSVQGNGAIPKAKTVEHSGPANNSQIAHTGSHQSLVTARYEDKRRSSITEKEIVSVSGDERDLNMGYRPARNEDGMNQYLNVSKNSPLNISATFEQQDKRRYTPEKEIVSVSGDERNTSRKYKAARGEDEINAKYNDKRRCSIPEKEIVSVSVDERDMSREYRAARDREGMSQYSNVSQNSSFSATQVRYPQKQNQGPKNTHGAGGRGRGVMKSHSRRESHNDRTQQHYASSPYRNRERDYTHEQHMSQSHAGKKPQGRKSFDNNSHQQRTQRQEQWRSPAHGSVRGMKCGSCYEQYNFQEKLPRNLHCGHSLCTLCIQMQINNDLSISCPHCQAKTWHIKDVECCKVNHLLLKILSKQTQRDFTEENLNENKSHSYLGRDGRYSPVPQPGNDKPARSSHIQQAKGKSERVESNTSLRAPHGSKCLEMGIHCSLYCSACLVWICNKCAQAEHKTNECLIVPLKVQLAKMKKDHDIYVKKAQELLNKSVVSLENHSDEDAILLTLMRAAFEFMEKDQNYSNSKLQEGRNKMNTLNDLLKSVPNVHNLSGALTTFQLMYDLAYEMNQWSSNVDLDATGADQERTTCLRYLMKRTLGSVRVEGGLFATDGQLFSELRVDGKKVHLHALRTDQPTRQGSRALPVQCFTSWQEAGSLLVFLDLSWGGKWQGRLYIRLIRDTLCGRQFYHHCIGEGGTSFRGTRFQGVLHKDQSGEQVFTGNCEREDGNKGRTQPVAKESVQVPAGGGVPVHAGLVAGLYRAQNLCPAFCIYTQGKKEMVEEAGFGEVESGLDVVKEAVKLSNIKDVMISDCGLVLEM